MYIGYCQIITRQDDERKNNLMTGQLKHIRKYSNITDLTNLHNM